MRICAGCKTFGSDMFGSDQFTQAAFGIGQIRIQPVKQTANRGGSGFSRESLYLRAAARELSSAERRRTGFEAMGSTPDRLAVSGDVMRAERCDQRRPGVG